jgi:N-acetylglutamate synthase-like GNAT family acetyltransferase
VALARAVATGEPAGTGLYPVPQANVTELAAVGTRLAFRHQGVAAAIMGHLVNRALSSDIRLVWLTAEHDEEEHAAQLAGFRRTGDEMIHISL